MKRDGKSLEDFIRQIEELHLPPGSSVEVNRLEHNDDGIQVAEFDVFIKGKLGTTEIVWLIECRDRPSSGAAPGSWIEQLIGRRQRFGFHKVTAVSTVSQPAPRH